MLPHVSAIMEQAPNPNLTDRISIEERARVMLRVIRILYQAGRLTKPQYVFNIFMYLEDVYEDRIMAGDYAMETNPIQEKMDIIKKAHGLSEDEYWRVREGPDDYEKLSSQCDQIYASKQIEIFKEFKEDELAHLLESDPDQFWDLHEQGRCSWFALDEKAQAIALLLREYEKEILICAQNGAYHAACILIGAAMEARLLLQCLTSPEEVKLAIDKLSKKPNDKNPFNWGLDTLLNVCEAGGWLPYQEQDIQNIEKYVLAFSSERGGQFLRYLRNFAHPGKYLRQRPHLILQKEEFEKAHAIYNVIVSSLC
jgi:hypothetical protein